MSEEIEGQDTGTEAIAGAVVGADPSAVTLALNGASRETADAFLNDQRTVLTKQGALIDDQRHHMRVQLRQLHLGIAEKWLGVLLRVATAFTGLAIAAGLAFLIWDASRSSGLLIEPFSVPPDLAARGLTGQVVAAQLLDRVAAMQAATTSQRAAQSYANSWSQQDIKLDIPETGVSLTELDNFLRDKLGHDIHVSGEVVHAAQGLSLTARAGADGASSVTGTDADLDVLVQRLSESIYRLTQPYRYGVYLNSHGRRAEGLEVFKALATTGPAAERPWGYNGWAIASGDSDGPYVSMALLKKAIQEGPDSYLPLRNLGNQESLMGRPEQAIADARKALTIMAGPSHGLIRAELVSLAPHDLRRAIDRELGAFHDAILEDATGFEIMAAASTGARATRADTLTGEHDLAAARVTLTDVSANEVGRALSPGLSRLFDAQARMLIARQTQDWATILAEARLLPQLFQTYPGERVLAVTMTTPWVAYANARSGDFRVAQSLIAATPADCYHCLITRAEIAEAEGQRARADFWFARAVQQAPSIPFAYDDWGAALLERKDYDGAIAKFTTANQKGPHFADPLEGWGEALMAKNQSHLALAKFEEADKYAPNWGRLHLKWGEALFYAGKKDEAQKQFALAAGLDLTPSDKTELAGISHG